MHYFIVAIKRVSIRFVYGVSGVAAAVVNASLHRFCCHCDLQLLSLAFPVLKINLIQAEDIS